MPMRTGRKKCSSWAISYERKLARNLIAGTRRKNRNRGFENPPLLLLVEEAKEIFAMLAAAGQAGSVPQDDGVVAVGFGKEFHDAVRIHDEGAADARKTVSGQLLFQGVEGFAQQMDLLADVQFGVIIRAANPVNLVHIYEKNPFGGLNGEPRGRRRFGAIILHQAAQEFHGVIGLMRPQ